MLRVELWVHRNASLDHGAASASGSLGSKACQGKLEGTPKLEDCLTELCWPIYGSYPKEGSPK